MRTTCTQHTTALVLVPGMYQIFAVKIFSLPHTATKIKIAKYFQLRIIIRTKYLRYEILQNAWQRSAVEYYIAKSSRVVLYEWEVIVN